MYTDSDELLRWMKSLGPSLKRLIQNPERGWLGVGFLVPNKLTVLYTRALDKFGYGNQCFSCFGASESPLYLQECLWVSVCTFARLCAKTNRKTTCVEWKWKNALCLEGCVCNKNVTDTVVSFLIVQRSRRNPRSQSCNVTTTNTNTFTPAYIHKTWTFKFLNT